MNSTYVIFITMPSPAEAQKIGRILVEERLAACVNIVEAMRSIYRWQGQVTEDDEVLCLAKTTGERLEALRARVVELHPYEVPEVVAIPIAAGHPPYLAWLKDAVAASKE